jgi:superfamily II DNA or RNA helicase
MDVTQLPRLIENKSVKLLDVLKSLIPEFKHLSIATGYWNLGGIIELIDGLVEYRSIRLLIGLEPLSPHLKVTINHDVHYIFPDDVVRYDLTELAQNIENRDTAKKMIKLISDEILEVKVFRSPRMHAKCYIFGNYDSESAVGIVGSSNFTDAGLSTNAELNAVEVNPTIIQLNPELQSNQIGHLNWFNSLWNDPEAVKWDGTFKEILESSPIGNLTFGPYDVYIKTLMEVFPDELVKPPQLKPAVKDVLFEFQDRNAGILINKLDRMGVAMLADSVGLGKTITAGAVMRHYLDSEREDARIRIIVPASLINQWEEDLERVLNIENHRDYQLFSMQDMNLMRETIRQDDLYYRRNKKVSLFIIDEAHNLRNFSGNRRKIVEKLLEMHPDSKVLLLTATPINNKLLDFSNEILLGAKGNLESVPVPWTQDKGRLEQIDFFEALSRIETIRNRALGTGNLFDWGKYKNTIATGLRHYLVRTTRNGIINEKKKFTFPDSEIDSVEYEYRKADVNMVNQELRKIENVQTTRLDMSAVEQVTQLSAHPLDVFTDLRYLTDEKKSVIINLFQAICCFGFAPYRPLIYRYDYYGKAIEEIDRQFSVKKNETSFKVKNQLGIHNLLHVSWLKRLESSSYSLMKSVANYLIRLESFLKYLNQGYIVSLLDTSLLDTEYAEDLEHAFLDYEAYQTALDDAIDKNETAQLKKYGVERIKADSEIYNVEQLKKDCDRDVRLANLMLEVLSKLSAPKTNGKLQKFVEYFNQVRVNPRDFGRKILVFSFFSDTIEYLQTNLPVLLGDDFTRKSDFITGKTKKNEQIVRRFSPKSKNFDLKKHDFEIDYLFATDILSEGQNLQDAGILINYDLHWNPVRMIQRSGRINRLGSQHSKVLVANCKPHTDLETYLKLVKRLENKLDAINNSIGLDQDVLKGDEANPMEFIEKAQKASDIEFVQGEDVLGWTDNFIADLKSFVETHSDAEVERIQKMPIGKWNYLPKTASMPFETLIKRNQILSLQRIAGRTSITNTPLSDTIFIRLTQDDPDGKEDWRFLSSSEISLRGEFIEDFEALNAIKTFAENNQRCLDLINVDRTAYDDFAKTVARVKAQTRERSFHPKPRQEDALTIVKRDMNDERDLLAIVSYGIKTARQKSDFGKLVTKINDEIRRIDKISDNTLGNFLKFIYQIEKNVTLETNEIEKQTSVLFYAPIAGGR